MSRVVRACALGFVLAALPMVAFAAEEATSDVVSRALPAPADTFTVALVAVLAVLGLFVVAALGYLYRRERHLEWEFQRPDAPHHDGGH